MNRIPAHRPAPRLACRALATLLGALGCLAGPVAAEVVWEKLLEPLPEYLVYDAILKARDVIHEGEGLVGWIRSRDEVSKQEVQKIRQLRNYAVLLGLIGDTDRGIFAINRLLKLQKKSMRGDRVELAETYHCLAYLSVTRNSLFQAEVNMDHALELFYRNRNSSHEALKRNLRFYASLLKVQERPYGAEILEHQILSFDRLRRRSYGGTRQRKKRSRRHQNLPALRVEDLRPRIEKLRQVEARIREAEALVPEVRNLSHRVRTPPHSFRGTEKRVLELSDQLAADHRFLEDFVFQMKRSGDLRVIQIRRFQLPILEAMLSRNEDSMEELTGYLLLTRVRQGF